MVVRLIVDVVVVIDFVEENIRLVAPANMCGSLSREHARATGIDDELFCFVPSKKSNSGAPRTKAISNRLLDALKLHIMSELQES